MIRAGVSTYLTRDRLAAMTFAHEQAVASGRRWRVARFGSSRRWWMCREVVAPR